MEPHLNSLSQLISLRIKRMLDIVYRSATVFDCFFLLWFGTVDSAGNASALSSRYVFHIVSYRILRGVWFLFWSRFRVHRSKLFKFTCDVVERKTRWQAGDCIIHAMAVCVLCVVCVRHCCKLCISVIIDSLSPRTACLHCLRHHDTITTINRPLRNYSVICKNANLFTETEYKLSGLILFLWAGENWIIMTKIMSPKLK